MYNLATCELDQRRHLVTDVRTMIHGVIYLSGHRVSPLEDVTSQHMLCCCCCCWCCCCCCCSRSRSRSHSCSHSSYRSHSRSCSCCFADSTCHQPVMAVTSLQELAAMHNLTTCELDKRRHLVYEFASDTWRHLPVWSPGVAHMSICLRSHIPYIPKSFGSHLFCVNIRALVSASITCCQIRMTGH